jgi:hypothetical protein
MVPLANYLKCVQNQHKIKDQNQKFRNCEPVLAKKNGIVWAENSNRYAQLKKEVCEEKREVELPKHLRAREWKIVY